MIFCWPICRNEKAYALPGFGIPKRNLAWPTVRLFVVFWRHTRRSVFQTNTSNCKQSHKSADVSPSLWSVDRCISWKLLDTHHSSLVTGFHWYLVCPLAYPQRAIKLSFDIRKRNNLSVHPKLCRSSFLMASHDFNICTRIGIIFPIDLAIGQPPFTSANTRKYRCRILASNLGILLTAPLAHIFISCFD